jgi:hypothetical protein
MRHPKVTFLRNIGTISRRESHRATRGVIRVIRVIRVIALVTLVTALAGCDGLSGGVDSARGGLDLPSEQETRTWRMVFVYLDNNELTATADNDIAGLAAFADRFGHTHRVVLRDSKYDGATVGLAAGGALRTVPLSSLPAGSLLEGSVLAEVLEILDREFPADQQALFLAGHGRGWSGIGYNRNEPRNRITADDLRDVMAALPENEGNLVVLDAGWSAFGELLYQFRDVPTDLVAAGTNLSLQGINYGALLQSLEASDWSREAMLHAVGQAFRNAGAGVEPAIFRESDLARIASYLDLLAAESSLAITTAPEQEALRSYLMERAVAPHLPGDAHIAVADLLGRIELADPNDYAPAFDALLLHLVAVDEIGLPAGHETLYRYEQDPAAPTGFFRDIPWAPDLFGGSGFLFDLWYREF